MCSCTTFILGDGLNNIHIDYFRGAAAELKRGKRGADDVLAVLAKHPRVSVWDMSELSWLRAAIGDLERRGLIESRDEPYPWHRYALTDAGRFKYQSKLRGWLPIETAPKDKRILVWSGQEIYAAHWVKHITTDDEAWIVAQWGDEGDQALVKPTHWMPLPEAPYSATRI